MQTTTKKETATDRYMVQREKALATLRRIEKAIQDHMDATDPETCHWGNVGVLASLNEELDRAAAVLTCEEV